MAGKPIRLEIRDGLKDRGDPLHAGSFLRERRIAFNPDLAADPRELRRIFVHELFHFVWLRLGNPRRHAWEDMLRAELRTHARGELGWSAEWRKRALAPDDARRRSRRWREYACESFCDTAAWIYSGVGAHAEFTLARRFRERRRQWFTSFDVTRRISV
jgi:predicted SprT family Zn-dependent metalloprotease